MPVRSLLPFLAVCLAASVSAPALSCSYAFPPRSVTAEKIATRGVVIRGVVVRRVDARRRRPLILRADQVYVGDGARTYIIYSSPRAYDLLRNPRLPRNSCESAAYDPPLGDGGLFVLEPAVGADGAENGMWQFSTFGGDLLGAVAGPILSDAAARTGRLRAPLPTWP